MMHIVCNRKPRKLMSTSAWFSCAEGSVHHSLWLRLYVSWYGKFDEKVSGGPCTDTVHWCDRRQTT